MECNHKFDSLAKIVSFLALSVFVPSCRQSSFLSGEIATGAPNIVVESPNNNRIQPSPFITVSQNDPLQLYAIQSIRGTKGHTRGRAYLWSADVHDLKWTNNGMIVGVHIDTDQLSDGFCSIGSVARGKMNRLI